jgi:hypothetical protein
MTNVIALNEMTSAAPALDATFGLDEYAVFYTSGEPSGEGFGLSHREAALWWARENGSRGDFIQVQRGTTSHTYWVDTHRDGSATVRECSV